MKWALVTTTNAPTAKVLDFVAYHLALGAKRLWIFLDAPNPEVKALLDPLQKVRVVDTDAAYWDKKGRRPDMHQPRQSVNARHAYNRSKQMDWLGHIDIDEFIWPNSDFAAQLAALPDTCQVARIRPVEALAPDPDNPTDTQCFKATPLKRQARAALTERLYPDYAGLLDDGFLSHVAGKIFVRTGHKAVRLKIHNATIGDDENPGQMELDATSLCHLHAEDWQTWRAHFNYRLEHGAYRASLGRKGPSGLTLHNFFRALIAEGGDEALRLFHSRLCTATPDHLAALQAEGLLHRRDLQLSTRRKQFFPNTGI